MIDDTELTSSLRHALRARADLVTGPIEPFDPERPAASTFVLSPAPARRWGRTGVLAAAVTVALVAAVTVATRSGQDEPANVAVRLPAATGSLAPATPDGIPVPTAAPSEGMALWGVTWQPFDDRTEPTGEDPGWTQLLGVEGSTDARILVLDEGATEGGAADIDWSNPVATIRGHDAIVGPHGDGAEGHEALTWREGDRLRQAAFRGMTATEAAAAVNSLQDRPDGAWGFDVPAGGPLTLLGESDANLSTTYARLVYATGPAGEGGPPDGPAAFVDTAPATGVITRAYLGTWFSGERADDGRVMLSLPQAGIVEAAWPDGRWVSADGGATAVPLAALEPLVTSAEPTSADQLTDLWSEVNDRLAALPVVGAADVGPAVVELRGNDGTPQALCVRHGEQTTCGAPGSGSSGAVAITYSDVGNTVNLLIGDDWYLATAAPDGNEVTFGPSDLLMAEASADGWTMWLTQPPDGVDVTVDYSDRTGGVFERP